LIAKLKGVVDTVDADSAIVDVGGVGYLVSASARTLRELAAGDEVTVLVETIVREDAIALYGFLETAERDWFRILTTVQGVGARVALSILSTLSPDEIARAIAAQDRATLSRPAGVGPKLAARLAILPLPDGRNRIQVQGLSDRQYVIQASPNLVNWNSVATNVSDSGTIQWTDPQPADQPRRFYRAIPRQFFRPFFCRCQECGLKRPCPL